MKYQWVFLLLMVSLLSVIGQENTDEGTTYYDKAVHFDQIQVFDSMFIYASMAKDALSKKEQQKELGTTYRLLSKFSYLTGRLGQGAQLLDTSIYFLNNSVGASDIRTIKAIHTKAVFLDALRYPDSAIQVLEALVDDTKETDFEDPMDRFKLFYTLGNINQSIGRLDKAFKWSVQGFDYAKPFFEERKDIYALAMSSRGNILRRIGKLGMAEEYMLNAYQMQGQGNPMLKATLMVQLGSLKINEKKYSEAELFLKGAREIHEGFGGKNSADYLNISRGLGYALSRLGKRKEAEEVFSECFRISENLYATDPSQKYFVELEYLSSTLGYEDSLVVLDGYVKLMDEIQSKFPNDLPRFYVKHVYNAALLGVETNRIAIARKFLNMIKMEEYEFPSSDRAFAYIVEAGYHLKVKDTTTSYQFMDKAVGEFLPQQYSRNTYAILPLDSIKGGSYFSEVAFYRAEEYYESGKTRKNLVFLSRARKSVEQALAYLEEYIWTNTSFKERIEIINQSSKAYKLYGDILYLLYELENDPKWLRKLFEVSENARSLSLVQSWKEAEAFSLGGITKEEQDELKEIQQNLAVIAYQLSHSRKADLQLIREWEADQAFLQTQEKIWYQKASKRYPFFEEKKYLQSTVVQEDIQDRLREGVAWIEFFQSREAVFAFFLSSNHFQVKKLNISGNELTHILSFFQDENKLKGINSLLEPRQELYQKLLGSFDQLSSYPQWIILPDAELFYLPFEILQNDAGNLIDQFRISYLYSGKIWIKTERDNQSSLPSTRSLAMAPEIVADQAWTAQLEETVRSTLVPLQGAAKEIEEINKFFPGSAYAGLEATEALFRKTAKNFNILHLATHGIINRGEPLYSKLMFGPGNDSTPENDGQLHTYEIFDLELKAELVTLSACHTGAGTYEEGEGVISLARGFAYAGCPNLVMSLWQVPDEATAILMGKFYEELAFGKPKDLALQSAKQYYIENSPPEKASPFYWAAWVLIGDVEPIRQPFNWWFYLGLGLGIMVIIGMFWLLRRKAKTA
ncbi:MAG: CHAT domain-containing tetratricopeptide repeat protein [Bacteroidota bacterium]